MKNMNKDKFTKKNIILGVIIIFLVFTTYFVINFKFNDVLPVNIFHKTSHKTEANKTVSGFLQAKINKDYKKIKSFLSPELIHTNASSVIELNGTHPWKFEILGIKLLKDKKTYKVTVKVYKKYHNEKKVGYVENNYYVKPINGRYLITRIKWGRFIGKIPNQYNTTRWIRYENKKYGFSFEYPNKIVLGKEKGYTVIRKIQQPNMLYPKDVFIIHINNPACFPVDIHVQNKPKKSFYNLEDYIKDIVANKKAKEGNNANLNITFNKYITAGAKGFVIEVVTNDKFADTSRSIYFEGTNYIVIINYNYQKKIMEDPTINIFKFSKYKVIEKIVSTFQFLE